MIDASKIGNGIEDVESAVQLVRNHAAEFHVDRDRIVLIGESSGAQLASMAAIRRAPVKAVVAFLWHERPAGISCSTRNLP